MKLGHYRKGSFSQRCRIDRHFSPPQDHKPLFIGDLFYLIFKVRSFCNKCNSCGICAGRWKFKFTYLLEVFIWNSNKNSRTISAIWFGSRCTAMLHVTKCSKCFGNYLVCCNFIECGNHGNAASIMFMCRVIKPLSLRIIICEDHEHS